ncbi:MAG: hypothetical protein ABJ327_21560 [Litoreibacter sp.]
MAQHGVNLDHATLNRWVEKYGSMIADEAHRRKVPAGQSWRIDETYLKVKVRIPKAHCMTSIFAAAWNPI